MFDFGLARVHLVWACPGLGRFGYFQFRDGRWGVCYGNRLYWPISIFN